MSIFETIKSVFRKPQFLNPQPVIPPVGQLHVSRRTLELNNLALDLAIQAESPSRAAGGKAQLDPDFVAKRQATTYALNKIALDLAESDARARASDIITGTEVVSEPGAALRVERLILSQAAKEMLRTDSPGIYSGAIRDDDAKSKSSSSPGAHPA